MQRDPETPNLTGRVELQPAVALNFPEYAGKVATVLHDPHIEILEKGRTLRWYHVEWPDGKVSCFPHDELMSVA